LITGETKPICPWGFTSRKGW